MECVIIPKSIVEHKRTPISISFLNNAGFRHLAEEWWSYQNENCRLLRDEDGNLILEFPLVKGSSVGFIGCKTKEEINSVLDKLT